MTTNIRKLLAGDDYIVLPRFLIKLFNSHSTAILYSELCALYSKFGNGFYFTQDDLCKTTLLSINTVKKCISELKNNGYLVIEKKGLPCKSYYHLTDKIEQIYSNHLDQGCTSKLVQSCANKGDQSCADIIISNSISNNINNSLESKDESLPNDQDFESSELIVFEPKEKSCAKKEKSAQDLACDRAVEFYNEVASYKDQYPKETLRQFYDYWTELNKSGTKLRFELEKTWDTSRRLKRWANNNFNNGKKNIGTTPDNSRGEINATEWADRQKERIMREFESAQHTNADAGLQSNTANGDQWVAPVFILENPDNS